MNGGIENMLVDIINFQIMTDKVYLLVVNDRIDDSIINRLDKRCFVRLLKRREGSKNPMALLKINRFILSHSFDVIHLHNADMIKYLLFKRNYVRTVHNTNIEYHNYRWHKGIISISNAVRDDLNKRGVNHCVVIDNGINFSLIKKKNVFKNNDSFRIVQVSRIFFQQKGQDILLEAIAHLLKKGHKNIHLDFIGVGPDFDSLKDLVKKYDLEKNITLLGNCSRDYIYEHLCSYDLFVQPSRFEGFGLTVVEAIGAYVPVLVSDNEGPLKIIESGKYGFTFKNKSIEDCSKRIEDIINNYPDKKFMDKAYSHVYNHYNIEKTSQKYLSLYKEIMNEIS